MTVEAVGTSRTTGGAYECERQFGLERGAEVQGMVEAAVDGPCPCKRGGPCPLAR